MRSGSSPLVIATSESIVGVSESTDSGEAGAASIGGDGNGGGGLLGGGVGGVNYVRDSWEILVLGGN